MPHTHDTVHATHKTDRAATSLVELWLGDDWLIVSQNPDYFVDYLLQAEIEGELSGQRICVQQKASAKLRVSHGEAKVQIKAKALLHYASKEKLPVFLFAVERAVRKQSGVGYFCFLQEYIDYRLNLSELEKDAVSNRKITVGAPITNRIDHPTKLREEIERALAYMKQKYPSTIAEAIEGEKKRLARIDPRFDYNVAFIEGVTKIGLRPKEDLNFKLTLGPEHVPAFHKHYSLGLPCDINGGIIKLEGSPLFEGSEALALSLRTIPAFQGEYLFECKEEPAFHFQMPCTATAGLQGLCVQCGWPESPIKMQVALTRGIERGLSRQSDFSISWSPSRWFNIPVDELPYFDQVRRFMKAVCAGRAVNHEIQSKGVKLIRGTLMNIQPTDMFRRVNWEVDSIQRLREISWHAGMVFKLNETDWADPQQFFSIDYAHALLLSSGMEYVNTSCRGSFDIDFNSSGDQQTSREEMIDKYDSRGSKVTRKFFRPNQKLLIHGTTIELGPVDSEIINCSMSVPEDAKAAFLGGEIDFVRVTFVCDTDGVLRFARAQGAENGAD